MTEPKDAVKRQPTGHRPPTGPEHPEQKTKSFPAEDAQANTTYNAVTPKSPNTPSKPLHSATSGVDLNRGLKGQGFDASLFQKSRQ